MQSSAQKARLCYLKSGLLFWLSSCRHLLQLFQRAKCAPAAVVSTFNTYSNKYYFITPILHLVSGPASESQALRASAMKPPWSMRNSLEPGRTIFTGTVARVMAWRRGGKTPHEERKARNYWENEIPESWEYDFRCYVWRDLSEYLQVKMNE